MQLNETIARDLDWQFTIGEVIKNFATIIEEFHGHEVAYKSHDCTTIIYSKVDGSNVVVEWAGMIPNMSAKQFAFDIPVVVFHAKIYLMVPINFSSFMKDNVDAVHRINNDFHEIEHERVPGKGDKRLAVAMIERVSEEMQDKIRSYNSPVTRHFLSCVYHAYYIDRMPAEVRLLEEIIGMEGIMEWLKQDGWFPGG